MRDSSSSVRPPRDGRWLWRLLILLILVIGLGGYVALQKFKPQPVVKPLVRQLPLVRTSAPVIETGALAVTGQGLVTAPVQVTVAAEVSGRVAAVSPSLVAGGHFKQGETLIELDQAPLRAARAQALAEVESTRVALSLAEQSVVRARELIAQGFQSRQTLDERLANRDQALASRARARALLDARSIDLGRTRITAPFAGRVLSQSVHAGDTVQPGRELARIFDDGTLEIAVSLSDQDIAMVDNPWRETGAPPTAARVEVEHGGQPYFWPARVDRIEAAVDTATRTFNMVVRVIDPRAAGAPIESSAGSASLRRGPPLLVGMFAQVRIDGRDQGPFFTMPRNVLRDNSHLWLVTPEDTIEIRAVRVIGERGDQVAIAAQPGSQTWRVVTSDLRVVTQGMAVRPLPDDDGAPVKAERQSASTRPTLATTGKP